jgi:hypothetical protein
MRIERVLLEDERDVAGRRCEAGDVVTADRDRSGVGALEAGDETKRRGLAGAGGPEKHEELAVGDREADTVDRRHGSEHLGYAGKHDFSHGRLRR